MRLKDLSLVGAGLVVTALVLVFVGSRIRSHDREEASKIVGRDEIRGRILGGEKGTLFYFHRRDCPDCEIVDRELVPAVLRLPPVSRIVKLDSEDEEIANVLFAVEAALGVDGSGLAPVWVFEGEMFQNHDAMLTFLARHGREGG